MGWVTTKKKRGRRAYNAFDQLELVTRFLTVRKTVATQEEAFEQLRKQYPEYKRVTAMSLYQRFKAARTRMSREPTTFLRELHTLVAPYNKTKP